MWESREKYSNIESKLLEKIETLNATLKKKTELLAKALKDKGYCECILF